jgi:hypothetical protein
VVRATLLIALAAVGIASVTPRSSDAAARCRPEAVSYPWPVRPFAQAHSVRGSLNEPRGRSFHFGVDITARDGQRVFAVQAGRAYGAADRTKVTVVGANGCWVHRYWHVVPAVADGTRVRPGSFIGRVLRPYAHVHLAEWDVRRSRYIDPTRRRGGLAPYHDPTSPVITGIAVKRRGSVVATSNVHGVVDLVVRTHDLPALASPAPWAHFRVTPATIGWRLRNGAGRTVRGFRLAYDGRVKLDDERFSQVFAPGTRQNVRGGKPAVYRYWLARRLDTRRFRNGAYVLRVRVADNHGNTTWASLPLAIRNLRPRPGEPARSR